MMDWRWLRPWAKAATNLKAGTFEMQWSSLFDSLGQTVTPGHAILLAVIIVGLVLWLLGRKLARPAGAISGLIAGGAAALAASQAIGDGGLLLVWMVVGCIIGAVLAWLLFRIWMGLAAAVVLGLVLPAAVVLFQGPPPQGETAAADEQVAEVHQPVDLPPADHSQPPDVQADELADDPAAAIADKLRRQYDKAVTWGRDWWTRQPPARQKAVGYTAAGGAIIGLLGGLAWPNLAATLLSALAGAFMVLAAGKQFIELYASDAADWVPQRLAVQLTILGLITALGVMVQWTIFRGEADK
jgi:hypothetical protein